MKISDDSQHRDRVRHAEASARLLVDAGPGTGKTEMAAVRMASLIRTGLSPGQMLVLSFSRSAVRNLTHRIARVTDTDDSVIEELRHVSVRTFDSWAFRMLRLLGRPERTLLARGHDQNIEALTGLITGSKRDRVRDRIGDRRHLIVDEFQDLPGVRGELVLALLELLAPPGQPGAGFTILGDPAQAIYGFGARSAEQTFPTPAEYWKKITDAYGSDLEMLTLTQNYRAVRPLADLSSALRRVLLGQKSDNEKLRVLREEVASLPSTTEPANPAWLRRDDSRSRAILTRTNGESLRVLQQLFGGEVQGGAIPVRLRAGNYSPLPPAWIAALLSRLKSTQLSRSQFSKIFDHLTQHWDDATCRSLGLPPKTAAWSRLCRASGVPGNGSGLRVPELRSRLHWPDAFPDDQMAGEDGLLVTTIHQSKGLEFDTVTILETLQHDARLGVERPNHPSTLEEANVHYVALTRAGQELNRLSRKGLYKPPETWKLPTDRERLCNWQRGWVNLEIGLRGDIDPFGFVDPDLHGGADVVSGLQDLLLRNACALQGHKVMLRKHTNEGKSVWHIHLQEADRPARLIGRTAPQLTQDLLEILFSRHYVLPKKIYNLRISAVGTVSSDAEFPLEDPYRTSRLWLGVSLFGTGDFKTYRRKD
ncbi:MAG: UvrD-helicase domain-containing protein [Bryobacterales bacterium]|nr:UvrD-helicase domain-containing protein [Bryobacterales bacterium]